MAHDPAIPSTVQLAIDWDPDAQCADFHRFLDDVIPADDQSRVWQLIGYMLMSGNPLHRAFLLAGGGRNGKGAFMRTVLALLGKGTSRT
jgi:putative DNA primase/helicase